MTRDGSNTSIRDVGSACISRIAQHTSDSDELAILFSRDSINYSKNAKSIQKSPHTRIRILVNPSRSSYTGGIPQEDISTLGRQHICGYR